MHYLVDRALIAAGLLILSVSGAQSKNCEFERVRLYQNQTSESHMTVKAGKRCSIRFGGTEGAVTETLITQKAKVGVAAADNSRIIYGAKAGFSGSDDFTYGRKGIDRYGNPSMMSAHILVNVVP